MNGATGNYSAHTVAYPEIDWIMVTDRLITDLGLEPHHYTTQIEPHDTLAEYLQIQIRVDTILIDTARDIW
jgi:adenylosuccinate lyase